MIINILRRLQPPSARPTRRHWEEGRLRCDKAQLEVVDDSVHHGEIGVEGNDLHPALAFGTEINPVFVLRTVSL